MAENLLIKLDLDPPCATKMVSEVGFTSKMIKPELRMTNEYNDDAELLEANFFRREPSRPVVRTQEFASVGPGIPHVGALWSGSPSPVVLFWGSRSAPVQRRPAAQTSVESGLLEDVARSSPHAVNSELDVGHSSEREARLQTLVANMSRQLHTLGYDWNDVPYYRSPPTQCLSTPVPVSYTHLTLPTKRIV